MTQQLIDVSRQADAKSGGQRTTSTPAWRIAKAKLETNEPLRADEVAALFDVTDSAVLNWARSGKLKAFKPEGLSQERPGKPVWHFMVRDVLLALGWPLPTPPPGFTLDCQHAWAIGKSCQICEGD